MVRIPAWIGNELQPVEKLETHLCGLRHKAVSVFVLQGSQILMQRRALTKYHTPGLWANTCCTHPHWGEDAIECAIRRLNDELGITGLCPEYKATIEYRADVNGGMIEHEVAEVFVASCFETPHLSPNPAEVSEYRWVELDELRKTMAGAPNIFVPWLGIYLRDHLADILPTA